LKGFIKKNNQPALRPAPLNVYLGAIQKRFTKELICKNVKPDVPALR
jgi:hypothetical protein